MKIAFAAALLIAGALADDKKRESQRFVTPVRSVDQFEKTTFEREDITVYVDEVKKEYEPVTKTEYTTAPRTVYDTVVETKHRTEPRIVVDKIKRTGFRDVPRTVTEFVDKEIHEEVVREELRDVDVTVFDFVPTTIYEQVPRTIVEYVQEKQYKEVEEAVVDIVQEVRYRDVPVTVYETVEVERYVDVYTVSSASDSYSDSGSYSYGSSRSYVASDANDGRRKGRIFSPYGRPKRGSGGGKGNLGYYNIPCLSSSCSDYVSDSKSNYGKSKTSTEDEYSVDYRAGNEYGLVHSHGSVSEDTTSEEGYYRPELVKDTIVKEHVITEREAYIVDVEVPRIEKRKVPIWVDVPVERVVYDRVPRTVKRRVPKTVTKKEAFDVVETVTKTVQVPIEKQIIDQEAYDYIEEVERTEYVDVPYHV